MRRRAGNRTFERDPLRAGRAATTGHPQGTIHRNWKRRTWAASAPDPTPTQAALEAAVLHITHEPGLFVVAMERQHPLGYNRTGTFGPYVSDFSAPSRKQLIIRMNASRNWYGHAFKGASLPSPWALKSSQGHLVDFGASQLVVGAPGLLAWIVGPNETSFVAADCNWVGERNAAAGHALPVPKTLARLARRTRLRRHSSDRLLSAMLRRSVFLEPCLSPHAFFDVGGELGLRLAGDSESSFRSPFGGISPLYEFGWLGIATWRELVEASLTHPALGIANTRVVSSRPDELVVADDDTRGRLVIVWGEAR